MLLEIILRIIGFVYISSRTNSDGIFSRFKKNPDDFVILCVGDSFTFGSNIDRQGTYPGQLQRMLNDNFTEREYKVVNRGHCELNSAQVLQRLRKNIHRYKPDLVILLVGAANKFNFIGFNKEKTMLSRTKDMFYGLRIYKMFKIMALNLKLRILLNNLEGNVTSDSRGLLNSHGPLAVLDPDRNIFDEMGDVNHDVIDYLKNRGEYDRASDYFKESFRVDPDSMLSIYLTSEFMQDIYDSMHDQRNLNTSLILKDLKQKLKNNPELKKDALFIDYVRLLEHVHLIYTEQNIDKRLREDLEDIINICRAMNIKIIIQDYPYPYSMADKALRDIARKYSLPLVENGYIFSELSRKDKKEDYFWDDTHCTPLGYSIMAENVYKVLLSEIVTTEHNTQEDEKEIEF